MKGVRHLVGVDADEAGLDLLHVRGRTKYIRGTILEKTRTLKNMGFGSFLEVFWKFLGTLPELYNTASPRRSTRSPSTTRNRVVR